MKTLSWVFHIVVVFLSLFLTSAVSAQVRYVHPDGNDAFNGAAWTDQGGGVGPWQTLSQALWHLNNDDPLEFDEIWIAMGEGGHVYTPHASDDTVSFRIEKPVAILGGFEGGETNPNQRAPGALTVLSGDLPSSSSWALRIMKIDVLEPEEVVTLDGLEFRGPDWENNPTLRSGGIETIQPEIFDPEDIFGSLVVQGCVFQGTVAGTGDVDAYGGAIRASNRIVRLRSCDFNRNTAKEPVNGKGTGGAIYLKWGTLRAALCTFEENFAGESGAAIATQATSAVVVNCDFTSNVIKDYQSASGGGGAIFHYTDLHPEAGTQTLTVNNCLFAHHRSGWYGGGAIFARSGTVAVRSSTFVDNSTTGIGGAIAFGSGACEGWLENPVVFDIEITNSIFWDNGPSTGAISDHYSWGDFCTAPDELLVVTITSQYNCVEATNPPSGTGNINSNPRFVDLAGSDYRLRRYSPAINTGSHTVLPDDVEDVDGDTDDGETHPWDLDSDERVRGVNVDMGAYEGPPCLADLNGDGVVDGNDLTIVLGQWSCTEDNCLADLNGDGTVDGSDLTIVLGQWGSCPSDAEAMMGSGGGPTSLAALMELLGVETVEGLVDVLLELDHEEMVTILEVFLGA